MSVDVVTQRSVVGQYAAAVAGGILGLWLYAALVGTWERTFTADLGPDLPGIPTELLWSALFFVACGMALGALAWIVLVEHRRPEVRFAIGSSREAAANVTAIAALVVTGQMLGTDQVWEEGWIDVAGARVEVHQAFRSHALAMVLSIALIASLVAFVTAKAIIAALWPPPDPVPRSGTIVEDRNDEG